MARSTRGIQGRFVEHWAAFGRLEYMDSGLAKCEASGLLTTDGIGGIQGFQFENVRRVLLNGPQIRVDFQRYFPVAAYVASASSWLQGGAIPPAWHIGVQTDQRGLWIRASDAAGVQVNLGAHGFAASFSFRACHILRRRG